MAQVSYVKGRLAVHMQQLSAVPDVAHLVSYGRTGPITYRLNPSHVMVDPAGHVPGHMHCRRVPVG